jgi:hypothetical protein
MKGSNYRPPLESVSVGVCLSFTLFACRTMRSLKLYLSPFVLRTNGDMIQGQTYQSILRLQGPGFDFLPANPIELIAAHTNVPIFMLCYSQCNMNPRCRTFVTNAIEPFVCRLYEGSVDTGTIISTSTSSQVSSLYHDASFYTLYGKESGNARKEPTGMGLWVGSHLLQIMVP